MMDRHSGTDWMMSYASVAMNRFKLFLSGSERQKKNEASSIFFSLHHSAIFLAIDDPFHNGDSSIQMTFGTSKSCPAL
jgi:UDP-N-acetyl-D-mannosaminuronic acid transferase (WecB/TagA/CpsF family)